jgi:hypothetical protein
MKTNRAKMQRRFKAMIDKAIELGFTSIIDAEKAGFSNELKLAYESAN